jgi:hypothetical protein
MIHQIWYVAVFWRKLPTKFLVACLVTQRSYSVDELKTSLFIYPTVAQLDCSKRMSEFTLKCSYMFQFNNHHQGATICALLKI